MKTVVDHPTSHAAWLLIRHVRDAVVAPDRPDAQSDRTLANRSG